MRMALCAMTDACGVCAGACTDEVDRPPVFVVPANVDLTPRQLSMMIETGHQPGVPFPVVTVRRDLLPCVVDPEARSLT